MDQRKDTEAQAADAVTSASSDLHANQLAASGARESDIFPAEPDTAAPAVRSGALIISVRAPEFSTGDHFAAGGAGPEVTEATVIHSSRWGIPKYAPLAAGIVLALAVGAVAGAAALSMARPDTSAAAVATVNQTRALQATVAQLNSEVTALKTALNSAQRTASTQMGKLTERLDRAERAQAEPAAKLAKISESVERIEKRQQQAPGRVAGAAANPDITGSIQKEEARPPIAEDWRLVDFYQGRAVVQSRNGVLFEVGPGSTLAGLGKVETIKRENGRVVVVTRNGTILASAEPRRPAPYIPYRY